MQLIDDVVEQIKTVALNTLRIEANAVQQLVPQLNDDFAHLVGHIFNSSGRVVVTGVGKSALIAQKIVATLNSTGTPAMFMHAADAIHGDLGMVMPNDVIVLLSKSGETPEIKQLVSLLKNLDNTLGAIVGKIPSFLSQQCHYVLNATVSQEACPINLAPTASTTAQLVLGDALAMCLLDLKQFSTNDFAKVHPGGMLGKNLHLKVSDVYGKNRKPLVKATTNLKDIIVEMTSKRLGATVVVNDNEEVMGIITDGDLRRTFYTNKNLNTVVAQNIMSHNPKTIAYDALAKDALMLMKEYKITQLVLIKKNKYVGMVHLHDLIQEGLT